MLAAFAWVPLAGCPLPAATARFKVAHVPSPST